MQIFLIVLFIFSAAVGCRTTTPDSQSSAKAGPLDPKQAAKPSDGKLKPKESFRRTNEGMFDGAVHEIDILLHGETWRKVVTHSSQGGNACTDGAPYGHIKEFRYKNNNTGEQVVINNAGIRVKGNTSCDEPVDLKGWRIKFNPVDKTIEDQNDKEVWRIRKIFEEWGKNLNYSDSLAKKIKDQRLYGLSDISLRKGANDPTALRDSLSSDIFEYGGELARKNNVAGAPRLGGPVYRAGLVWVKIHTGFQTLVEGHYGIAEIVGDDMVESHYGKEALSHLYKIKEAKGTFLSADMPADRRTLFKYYDPDVIDGDGFTNESEYDIKKKLCREGKYEQKKCDKIAAQRDRAEKILRGFKVLVDEALAAPTLNERRAKIEAFLDVENILSYMVAVNLSGHWDSMVGSIANNDYLFHNKINDKWGILTWDLDNTFGTSGKSYPWMASMTDFGVDLKYRPLFKLVMDNYPERYKTRVQDFMNGVFKYDSFGSRITTMRDRIEPNSRDEKYQTLYRFKDHRYGNVWCNLNNKSRVKIKGDGWPDVKDVSGSWQANCE